MSGCLHSGRNVNIKAVAEEVHRYGRLLHVYFHSKCRETVANFAEIGIELRRPFERPPRTATSPAWQSYGR